jgi:two-component system sensor histidine kinase VicK
MFWVASQKTKILHRTDVLNSLVDIFSSAADTINICGNSKFASQLLSLETTKKAIVSAKNNGIKQRYLFDITKDNIKYCRNLIEIVGHDDYFRHSDEIEANFVVNEKQYLGSITLKEPHQQAIYSNMEAIVEQQHHIFGTLWNNARRLQDRIRETEEGIEAEFYEVINNYEKAQEKYISLARSIDKEGLLLFANSKAMLRANKIGVIDYLIEASTKKGALIRIICPITEENFEIVKTISEKAPDIRILNYDDGDNSSHSGLFVVDRKKFMRFELKEPKAEEFSEAIGFIVYSNNKVGIESSKSFFELLWNERVQKEKLKEYEKLKEADKMKTEFINIAAHELRTPIQPILGLTEILRSDRLNAENYNELLDIIIRNAKRLQRLTEDILDVTKIESHSLILKKEDISINDLISHALLDFKHPIGKKGDDGKLNLLYDEPKQDIFVKADKYRLRQVITNLLGNAVKFTKKEGTIFVTTEEEKKKDSNDSKEVVITIKDTGTGIDPEIMPKLFSKFASKSFQGTGLGLYISKNIIEAHGGRIWAQNNPDGKGATFFFTLPLQMSSSKLTYQTDIVETSWRNSNYEFLR